MTDVASASVTITPDLEDFRARLDADLEETLAGVRENVKVGLDDGDARVQMDDLALRADALGAKREDIKVSFDTSQFSEASAALQRFIAETDSATGRLSALGGAGGSGADGLDRLRAAADGARGDGGGGLGGLMQAAAALSPALVTLGGVGAGALLSMGSALLTVGGGLGAVAVVAKPTITSIESVTKAQDAFNTAVETYGPLSSQVVTAQERLNAAVAAAGPGVVDAANAWDNLTATYKNWARALEPGLFPALTQGVNVIRVALNDLTPIIQTMSPALVELGHYMETVFSSTAFQRFVNFIATNAGPELLQFARIISNVGESVANMAEEAQPFTQMIMDGLEHLSERLRSFSQSNTFQDFVNWLMQEGPVVANTVENIVQAVGKLATAAAPVGSVYLQVLSVVSRLVDEFLNLSGPLDSVIIGVASFGYGISKIVGPIQSVISAVSRVTEVIGNWILGAANMGALSASYEATGAAADAMGSQVASAYATASSAVAASAADIEAINAGLASSFATTGGAAEGMGAKAALAGGEEGLSGLAGVAGSLGVGLAGLAGIAAVAAAAVGGLIYAILNSSANWNPVKEAISGASGAIKDFAESLQHLPQSTPGQLVVDLDTLAQKSQSLSAQWKTMLSGGGGLDGSQLLTALGAISGKLNETYAATLKFAQGLQGTSAAQDEASANVQLLSQRFGTSAQVINQWAAQTGTDLTRALNPSMIQGFVAYLEGANTVWDQNAVHSGNWAQATSDASNRAATTIANASLLIGTTTAQADDLMHLHLAGGSQTAWAQFIDTFQGGLPQAAALYSQIFDVTPAQAMDILERNSGNAGAAVPSNLAGGMDANAGLVSGAASNLVVTATGVLSDPTPFAQAGLVDAGAYASALNNAAANAIAGAQSLVRQGLADVQTANALAALSMINTSANAGLPGKAAGGITDGPTITGEGGAPEIVLPTDNFGRWPSILGEAAGRGLLPTTPNAAPVATSSAAMVPTAPNASMVYSPSTTVQVVVPPGSNAEQAQYIGEVVASHLDARDAELEQFWHQLTGASS